MQGKVPIKVFEVGCCGESHGEEVWVCQLRPAGPGMSWKEMQALLNSRGGVGSDLCNPQVCLSALKKPL